MRFRFLFTGLKDRRVRSHKKINLWAGLPTPFDPPTPPVGRLQIPPGGGPGAPGRPRRRYAQGRPQHAQGRPQHLMLLYLSETQLSELSLPHEDPGLRVSNQPAEHFSGTILSLKSHDCEQSARYIGHLSFAPDLPYFGGWFADPAILQPRFPENS